MKENPYIALYTVVPSYIYQTKELTSEEKLIAERIIALCKKKGHAWITNKKLADMYGIREDTASKHIRKLVKYGLIKCTYGIKNNNERRSRVIYLTDNIWDKYNRLNSTNNQNINGHSNQYNNKNNNRKNNNLNNGENNYYKEKIIPEWMKNPDMCKSTPCTKEELKEMEDLLKEFK